MGHLIMGQITITQNLVAIKDVRHGGQWQKTPHTPPSRASYGVSEFLPWWRHQMEKISVLLATSEFPSQKASDAELWCFLWYAPEQTAE